MKKTINFDEISTISCFPKPLPLRGMVPKTKTKSEKSQDKSKSSARCPTRVPCQVAHGGRSHTHALRRHSPHPAIGFQGVWLLILWVAPRLNPRAEPEHYIQALAPAEAEKNEGVGASPPRCGNNAYAVLHARQASAPRSH